MKIKKILAAQQSHPNKLQLLIDETTPNQLNQLRKYLDSSIKSYAISTVNMIENKTLLNIHQIISRLAFIPIISSKRTAPTLNFSLNSQNNEDKLKTIYS